jgi:hypothetical protein
MKKINKDTILSKEYKTWLDSLDETHPQYNSSNNKHYFDIKMSLLHCQGGLCAYTEQQLCDERYIDISCWNDKKYTATLEKDDIEKIQGDLEHFDESLKFEKAWLWENLFVVLTHANCRIKGTKPIKALLKPDGTNYDEDKYLQFDFDTGVFFPHPDLSDTEKEDVGYMISTLGINCISSQRKKQLSNWKDMYEVGLDVNPHEYPTAWKMTLKSLN